MSNLNWWNVAVLLLLALFIFGDKLPQMISDGLRMLRNLRRMAQNAASDLSRELGTDIQFEDLNPKTFVRKHLLSEADQEELTRPLKGVSDDLARHARGVGDEVTEAGKRLTGETGPERGTGRGRGPGRGTGTGQGVGTGAAAEPAAELAAGAETGAELPGGTDTVAGAPPRRAGYDDIT